MLKIIKYDSKKIYNTYLVTLKILRSLNALSTESPKEPSL